MKIHIAIGQYEFIEADADSIIELKDIYSETQKVFSAGNGLDEKTWREVLDRYLADKKMNADDYGNMSEKQQAFIQEIKRSYKRTDH
jgi:hypothetical protein